jgi:hypothetical protein
MKIKCFVISNLVCIVIISSLLHSCSLSDNEKTYEGLKGYYFPIDSINPTKVYHYRSKKDSTDLFWELTTQRRENKTFLFTKAYSYNAKGEIVVLEELKEEINDKGAYLKKYVQYEHVGFDTLYKLNSTILETSVMLWEPKYEESISWSLSNESKQYENIIRFISKDRTLINSSEMIEFKGQTFKAVKFGDVYKTVFTNKVNGKVENINEFHQDSYYAENIGLYKYSRRFNDNSSVTFTLQDIFTLKEWQEIISRGHLNEIE